MPDVYRFKLVRGSSSRWLELDPVLLSGEPGLETDTGVFKIGDGLKRWSQLDRRYVPESTIIELIAEYGGVGEGGVTQQQLDEHVESSTPHPAYDEGPDLVLIYENAKV